MKKQSFVFGAIILAVSGVLCKILGAVYKIPLTNILGIQGMGIYYLIFPIYAFLLTLTSSSFTMAISKFVSKSVADNKKLLAFKGLKASFILLLILGLTASLILVCFARLIALLQGVENAFICYIAIAPAVVIVSLSCAFKGYFQGLQNMVPSAVAQVLDQIVKLSCGFVLAKLLSKKGVIYGAVGSLVGITIAEVATCLFFVFYFLIFKRKNKKYFLFASATEEEKSVKINSLMKEIFKLSLPFTLSSVILPMSLVVDSFLIINILKSMQFDKAFATGLLGLNSGLVNTLISLPSTLSVAICMTIIPYIAFALSKKDYESINSKTVLAFKLTFIISIPCVFVFICFAPQIIKILYSHSFSSVYEFNVASSMLMLSSVNVLYLALLQLTTALLQAINRSYVPVASLSVALIFKVLCEIVLINVPYLNIFGAVISNTICYIISTAINIYYFKKSINLSFSFYKIIVSPLIASALTSMIIFGLIKVFGLFLGTTLSVLSSFALGAIMYIILIFLLKTFTKEEKSSLMFFKKVQN